MANTDAKFGFRPIRHISGGCITVEKYSIASAYGSNIGYGHPVEITGTGKNIQLAAANNADNLGIFVGCKYTDSQGAVHYSRYWPASTTATDIVANVIADPNVVFMVQADNCAEGDVGTLCDWNAGTTNTTTGNSGAYLEVNGNTATTNQAVRVLGLVDDGENAYGAYAKIEVQFAEHAIGNVVAGVGGV